MAMRCDGLALPSLRLAACYASRRPSCSAAASAGSWPFSRGVVTTGLYGTLRHPSYLGLIVMMLGWGLAFRSLVGVALAVLVILPFYWRASGPRRRCSRSISAGTHMPLIAPVPIVSFLGFIDLWISFSPAHDFHANANDVPIAPTGLRCRRLSYHHNTVHFTVSLPALATNAAKMRFPA